MEAVVDNILEFYPPFSRSFGKKHAWLRMCLLFLRDANSLNSWGFHEFPYWLWGPDAVVLCNVVEPYSSEVRFACQSLSIIRSWDDLSTVVKLVGQTPSVQTHHWIPESRRARHLVTNWRGIICLNLCLLCLLFGCQVVCLLAFMVCVCLCFYLRVAFASWKKLAFWSWCCKINRR